MRPSAHILTIGNEVLKGSVLNTNAKFLGQELTELGFEVFSQSSCRDVISEIREALDEALLRADLVILSGGLGPTPDDLTRDAVAEYFQVPLEFSQRQFDFIKGYYQKRKRNVPDIVKREALFPKNAKPLFNRFGIALGFYILQNQKMVVVLPGVPMELEKMFDQLVRPVLRRRFPGIPKRYKLMVKTVGLSEPGVMQRIGKDFFKDTFDFGIYPHLGEVTLRIYAEQKAVTNRLGQKMKQRLAGSIYATEEISLSEAVGRILKKKRKTLAAAESCTGGLLSSMITQVPGASAYFRGSVTVYHPEIKVWLGVSRKNLKKNGLVSSETARQLADQARKVLGADYGIGITGIAGPKREGKIPVGRVFIAISSAKQTKVYEENFLGERPQIQIKAATKALEYLWKILTQK